MLGRADSAFCGRAGMLRCSDFKDMKLMLKSARTTASAQIITLRLQPHGAISHYGKHPEKKFFSVHENLYPLLGNLQESRNRR